MQVLPRVLPVIRFRTVCRVHVIGSHMYPFLQACVVDDVVRRIHMLLAPSDVVTVAMTSRRERRAYIVENPAHFTKATFIPVVAARHGYRTWLFWWFTEVWETHIAPFWASDRDATDEVLEAPWDSIAFAAGEAGYPDIIFLAAAFMRPTRSDWERTAQACLTEGLSYSTPCHYPPVTLRALLDANLLSDLPYALREVCSVQHSRHGVHRPRNFLPLVQALRAYTNDEIIHHVLPVFLFNREGAPHPAAWTDHDAIECIWHCMGGDDAPMEKIFDTIYIDLSNSRAIQRCAQLWPPEWTPRLAWMQAFEDLRRKWEPPEAFSDEVANEHRVGRALGLPWYCDHTQ